MPTWCAGVPKNTRSPGRACASEGRGCRHAPGRRRRGAGSPRAGRRRAGSVPSSPARSPGRCRPSGKARRRGAGKADGVRAGGPCRRGGAASVVVPVPSSAEARADAKSPLPPAEPVVPPAAAAPGGAAGSSPSLDWSSATLTWIAARSLIAGLRRRRLGGEVVERELVAARVRGRQCDPVPGVQRSRRRGAGRRASARSAARRPPAPGAAPTRRPASAMRRRRASRCRPAATAAPGVVRGPGTATARDAASRSRAATAPVSRGGPRRARGSPVELGCSAAAPAARGGSGGSRGTARRRRLGRELGDEVGGHDRREPGPGGLGVGDVVRCLPQEGVDLAAQGDGAVDDAGWCRRT